MEKLTTLFRYISHNIVISIILFFLILDFCNYRTKSLRIFEDFINET